MLAHQRIYMKENTFTDCEKSLTANDFALIEQDLSIRLPAELKEHYLKYNGGTPKNSVWHDPEGKWDENEVRDFLPFLYFSAKQDDPDFTINGTAKEEWNGQQLPRELLPFAIDWGGNYFCVNQLDEKIYYFIRDSWSDNLTLEKNWIVNTRYITDGFSKFVKGLRKSED